MAVAPVIVGFVSQKGGTGKSTLARALGAVVAAAGLKVRIADLDPQQKTVLEWEKLRQQNATVPALAVEGFESAAEAIASAEADEPPCGNRCTSCVSAVARCRPIRSANSGHGLRVDL